MVPATLRACCLLMASIVYPAIASTFRKRSHALSLTESRDVSVAYMHRVWDLVWSWLVWEHGTCMKIRGYAMVHNHESSRLYGRLHIDHRLRHRLRQPSIYSYIQIRTYKVTVSRSSQKWARDNSSLSPRSLVLPVLDEILSFPGRLVSCRTLVVYGLQGAAFDLSSCSDISGVGNAW
jgi:hypothetical protein